MDEPGKSQALEPGRTHRGTYTAHTHPTRAHLLQQLPQLFRAGIPGTHGLLGGNHRADTPALAVLGRAVHLPALLRVGGQHLERGRWVKEGREKRETIRLGTRACSQGRLPRPTPGWGGIPGARRQSPHGIPTPGGRKQALFFKLFLNSGDYSNLRDV